MREIKHASKVFVGRHEGKRLLGKPGCKWEDNIKTDGRETGCEDADLIQAAQDFAQFQDFMNAVINIREPSKQGISYPFK
jgi:hypothetical protein